MRKTHLFDIGCQRFRQFTVGHITILFRRTWLMPLRHMPPGAEMHLVNRDGRAKLLALPTLLHPLFILPGMTVNVRHNTGSVWTQLAGKSIRVGLINGIVVIVRIDSKFVQRAFPYISHKTLPDPQVIMPPMHGSRATIPAIKVSNHRNSPCVRCPYSKMYPFHSINSAYMCSHLLINAIVLALPKKV